MSSAQPNIFHWTFGIFLNSGKRPRNMHFPRILKDAAWKTIICISHVHHLLKNRLRQLWCTSRSSQKSMRYHSTSVRPNKGFRCLCGGNSTLSMSSIIRNSSLSISLRDTAWLIESDKLKFNLRLNFRSQVKINAAKIKKKSGRNRK